MVGHVARCAVREARPVSGQTALDLDGVWQETLRDVLRAVTGPMERRWLASTLPVGFSDDTLVLAAPHAFARDWLERSCTPLIAAGLEERAGRPITLVVTVSTQAVGHVDPADVADALATPVASFASAGADTLDERARLDPTAAMAGALVADIRAAPGRNDPVFEPVMQRLAPRWFAGFRKVGVLVKNTVGMLQGQRYARKDGISRLTSNDEAEMVRYLTQED
jgi:hypothetical protein